METKTQEPDKALTPDGLVLNLEGAANYLKFNSEYIRRMAKRKAIRAAKIGKCWRFFQRDLDAWLDSYCDGGPKEQFEKKEWRSIDVKKVVSGTLTYATKDSEYLKALGRKTRMQHSDTTTK